MDNKQYSEQYSEFFRSFNKLIKEINSVPSQQRWRSSFSLGLNDDIITININRNHLKSIGALTNMYFPLIYEGKFVVIQRWDGRQC